MTSTMIFEWDDNKEQINIKKHGIDFETASYVFYDDCHIEIFDAKHSDYEERFLAIGMVNKVTYIVTVVYTERGESIRIISARKATKEERELYYDYSQGN